MTDNTLDQKEQPLCELCGEPMPKGEEMFKYHGYSGNCPKPPKQDATKKNYRDKIAEIIWRNQPAKANGLDEAYKIADKILEVLADREKKMLEFVVPSLGFLVDHKGNLYRAIGPCGEIEDGTVIKLYKKDWVRQRAKEWRER